MKRKCVLLISDIVSAAEENPKETEQQASPDSSKEAPPKHRAQESLSQLTSGSQAQKRSHNQNRQNYNILPQSANLPETHMLPGLIHNSHDPRFIQTNPPLILTMGSPSNPNLVYAQSSINVNGTMLVPVNSYSHVVLPIYRPNYLEQNLHQQLHQQQQQFQSQPQHQTHHLQFNILQQQLLHQHPPRQHQHQLQIEHQHQPHIEHQQYQFDHRQQQQQQQEQQPQLQLQRLQQQLEHQIQDLQQRQLRQLQQRQLQQLQRPDQPLHQLQVLDQQLNRPQLLEQRVQELHPMQKEQLHRHENLFHLNPRQQQYLDNQKDTPPHNSQGHKGGNSMHHNNQNKRKSLTTRTASEISQENLTNQINFQHQLGFEGVVSQHRNSCTRCRKLKKKCDKQEFQCQNCKKFSLSCVYLPRKQRKRGERRKRKQQNSPGLEGDLTSGTVEGKLKPDNEVDEKSETKSNLQNK